MTATADQAEAIDEDGLAEALMYAIREHVTPGDLYEWTRDSGPEMSLGSPQRINFDAVVADLMAYLRTALGSADQSASLPARRAEDVGAGQ